VKSKEKSRHLRIDDNLVQPLKIEAAKEGVTMRQLASKLIRQYLVRKAELERTKRRD